MITLEQAIQLATDAHQNQWRKSREATLGEASRYTLSYMDGSPTMSILDGNKYELNHGILTISKPYITHPLAIMNMMSTEEEKTTAVLHDVIEDTKAELVTHDVGEYEQYAISFNGYHDISFNTYRALLAITKMENQPYENYLNVVIQDKLAIKVKIADICHNLSDNPSTAQCEKYLKALPILLKAL